jgi:hypothetical protein
MVASKASRACEQGASYSRLCLKGGVVLLSYYHSECNELCRHVGNESLIEDSVEKCSSNDCESSYQISL